MSLSHLGMSHNSCYHKVYKRKIYYLWGKPVGICGRCPLLILYLSQGWCTDQVACHMTMGIRHHCGLLAIYRDYMIESTGAFECKSSGSVLKNPSGVLKDWVEECKELLPIHYLCQLTSGSEIQTAGQLDILLHWIAAYIHYIMSWWRRGIMLVSWNPLKIYIYNLFITKQVWTLHMLIGNG